MRKLSSIKDFKGLQARLIQDSDPNIPTIVISAGTCGQASGANDLIRVAKRELITRGFAERVKLRITGCHGWCEIEPSVLVEPRGTLYPNIDITGMERIVEAVDQGRVVEDLLYEDPGTGQRIEKAKDTPFYNKQRRTILAKNEKVDPIRIFNYIQNEGYKAFVIALAKDDPAWVIDQVKTSGIRGRGGAGFPTGMKWELLSKQPNGRGKILVCNADEGDPGAYMDRSVLEGNPHSILEGMLIGAYATGANEGIIYVRAEYPLAIKHLVIAIRQARELGLLGENILGTGFSFDIHLVRGAGAFVCGEETALIASIEGRMGEPRQRPPFPIQKGVEGCPTAINNVETWANIPEIINIGGSEFAKIGTPGNSGTKIFSLVGKAKYTGLVEVPLGMKISDVVYDIGGGSAGKAKIKAVQTGGPSGGCIPASMFDTPIDYDNLAKAGSIMGSGGMIVMDENTCMVDVARYFMNFLKDESCGKCFTCRKGTQRMYEILDDITKGRATMEHLDLLEELALVVKDTTMCGLGQSAANPVLSTLKYFRHEYESHIKDKKCDSFVCKELVGAPCQSACPLDTEAWRYVAHIARGEYEDAYKALREVNPLPSICGRVCDHPCESRCRAGSGGGDPIAIRALKRFVTDRVDPSIYHPNYEKWQNGEPPKVAVIGSGPAGITTAHYLSLKGMKVTLYEAEEQIGGMLTCAIPSYRLSRDVIQKEIHSLLNDNITVKTKSPLGLEVTLDKLFESGHKAVLLAMGAHKSRPLELEGENLDGVYPSIKFLKAFNLNKVMLAKGKVGVIGGGNSAIDAARMALRQKDVEQVTILYRRTKEEMPAFAEEIEAAEQEGIKVVTLVTPEKIIGGNGRITGLSCVKNSLGDVDSSGRRRPVPIEGTEYTIDLDTLIVAISEDSGIDCLTIAGSSGIELTKWNTVRANNETLMTNREGVFAAGDLVTGPNTVVEAIAAGKKAAKIIERYILGEPLQKPATLKRPSRYIEPLKIELDEMKEFQRAETPRAPAEWRKRSFAEVEVSLSAEEAQREARRCLRCDLEFTQPVEQEEPESIMIGETTV